MASESGPSAHDLRAGAAPTLYYHALTIIDEMRLLPETCRGVRHSRAIYRFSDNGVREAAIRISDSIAADVLEEDWRQAAR